MTRAKQFRDPRGHSLRIYDDTFDSPAFNALDLPDVRAYLSLLRDLRGHNNGDLSLPLTVAKERGIKHHVTLARSLRALCAVGLVAITRKGGCTKGGRRTATLYRVTDRECFAIPSKFLEALPATNEWKKVMSVEHGRALIAAAELVVKGSGRKTKAAGHQVTDITSPDVLVGAKTRTPRDTGTTGPGHDVTMAESGKNLASMRVPGRFNGKREVAGHRTSRVPPLYIATPDCEIAADVEVLA